jgi:NADP-dependent 3-hydroxy acid dehydrogenase YdfG
MRTVVVGASSGLGRCIAIGLGQRGAKVALLARRKDKLAAAAKEAGGGAVAIVCDVTDPSSCRAESEWRTPRTARARHGDRPRVRAPPR